MSGMPFPSSVGFLPSPLAGEGLGERGVSAGVSACPPLPNPSPARGEGLKARLTVQIATREIVHAAGSNRSIVQ